MGEGQASSGWARMRYAALMPADSFNALFVKRKAGGKHLCYLSRAPPEQAGCDAAPALLPREHAIQWSSPNNEENQES